MAEIYQKAILYIEEKEYEVGDVIDHLRWKQDAETENEVYNILLRDITEDTIYVWDGRADDLEIRIEDIIG